MADAMTAEFGTVAEWTAQTCLRLGREYHLPGACRGSGNPHALDWLIRHLGMRPSDTLVDSGAGIGGPAAYAAQNCGVSPVLIEPEAGACRAAKRLFRYPVAQASGVALPIADGAADSAWSLGVLCTTPTPDQIELLKELQRVVRPGGSVGVLVFVANRDIAPDEQPAGNHFPSRESLLQMFGAAQLTVTSEQAISELAAPLPNWQVRADRVETELQHHHGDTEAWKVAHAQSQRMGSLIGDSAVSALLFALRAV